MYEMVEKLTMYGEAVSYEGAIQDVLIYTITENWNILVEPFPVQSDIEPFNYVNGKVQYVQGKPVKWGYVLHKFYQRS